MDFKSIESKFKAFIEKETKSSGAGAAKKTSFEDTSIFLNHDKVNSFVKEQYGLDSENSSINLKEFLNLDIEDGQFVDTNEYDFDDIDIEGADDFLAAIGKKPNTEKSDDIGGSMIDVVNDILSDKDMQKAIDANGDGKISKSEIQSFFKSAAEIDGNKDDISIEDLFSAVDAVKNADKLTELLKEEESVPEVENNAPVQSTGGGSYGGSGVSGGYSPSSAGSSTSADPTKLENMSKEQLQTELSKANGDLSDKQDVLSKILDGSDPQIQELQEAVDEAYDKWQEQLKEVDEKMAKQVEDLNKDITAKEDEISAKEGEISDAECALSDAKTSYANAQSTTANLQNLLSSLQSQNSSENDLSGQISEVQSKISASQQAEAKAKTAIDEAEEKLNGLKEDKEKLQGELDELNEQMTELQEEIAEKHPEIKEYMDDYNKAKDTLTTEKASAVEAAKAEVVEAQKRVDEVQTAISNYEDKETTSKYTPTSLPKDIQERLDAKLGAGFTAKLEEISKRLNCDPEDLLRVMSSESGLNPAAVNGSSGSTGLIQFMPDTARALGTSTAALAKMSGVEQLDYVEKCFSAYIDGSQKVSSGRLYATIFLPGRITGDDNAALTSAGEGYYSGNAGLDTNHDGKITIQDLTDRLNNIDYRSHI